MSKMDNKREKVSHLVRNWTKFKLTAYPWPNADDAAVDNKLRAIFNEMKNSGFYDVNQEYQDSDLESLIQEAQAIAFQS